jgi:GT2 family glycosyltransferase
MALIATLSEQARLADATIIVADNACDVAVHAALESFRPKLPIHCIPVPARGVSQARNALVDEAGRLVPDWRWLVMLDDDGEATHDWLKRILACGEEYGADLVGGPVIGVLPPGSSRLAQSSVFATRGRWPTGPVPMLNTTQNLAIARKLLDRIALPLFDRKFGASGGEDYDLFRRTVRAGGRLVWCDEAEVFEPAPADRLTTGALFRRYYTTGTYMAVIDVAYDGWSHGLATGTRGAAASLARAALHLSRNEPDSAARSVLMVAHYAGRLAGLLGVRTARYTKKESS